MSLKPEYAPLNESSNKIWEEESHFVGDTVLGAFALGITFAIYVQCIIILIPYTKIRTKGTCSSFGTKRKWAIIHLTYCTMLFYLVTIGTALNARYSQLIWINNRNYPGGPSAFVAENTNLPSVVGGWTSYTLAAWLQDVYVLYRFLIFYDWNYWLCMVPILLFAGTITASIGTFTQFVRPNEGISQPEGRHFLSACYILSVSLNVIVTFAIVGKLWWKRRAIISFLGKRHARLYTSVAAMLIESAALYSFFALIYVGLFLRGKSAAHLFLPFLGCLSAISPMLIIYRVSSGKGWMEDTSELIANGGQKIQFSPPPMGPLVLSASLEDIARFTTAEILALSQSVTNVSRRSSQPSGMPSTLVLALSQSTTNVSSRSPQPTSVPSTIEEKRDDDDDDIRSIATSSASVYSRD